MSLEIGTRTEQPSKAISTPDPCGMPRITFIIGIGVDGWRLAGASVGQKFGFYIRANTIGPAATITTCITKWSGSREVDESGAI